MVTMTWNHIFSTNYLGTKFSMSPEAAVFSPSKFGLEHWRNIYSIFPTWSEVFKIYKKY